MTQSDRRAPRRVSPRVRAFRGWSPRLRSSCPRPARSLSLAAALAAALAGCARAPDYVEPDFAFAAGRWSAGSGQPGPVLLDNVAWWQSLHDPVLTQLVDLALAGNVTLEAARARAVAALAARDQVPGSALLSPEVNVRAEGTERSGPDLAATMRVGLNWMLDPWGGRASRLRAADLRAAAAEADLAAARLLLIHNMTGAYLDLRHRQRLLEIAAAEQVDRTTTLRLTRALRGAEEATRLETTRAEARLAELRADRPALEAGIAGARARVAVLAGTAPGTLPDGLEAALVRPGGQPLPHMGPDLGIPADLLRNRPDIRAAERRYAAAVAEIGAARADLYPSLSLTGLISLDLLGGGADYILGPTLALPDLTNGTARAGVAAAEARAQVALAEWRELVLQALLEVETALTDYAAATRAAVAAEEALRLYRQTRSLTRSVYEQGESTLSDLISAETAVASAERRVADLRLSRALSFAELNIRLGAGHRVQASAAGGF